MLDWKATEAVAFILIVFGFIHVIAEAEFPELGRPLASALASCLIWMSVEFWELRNRFRWYKNKCDSLEIECKRLKKELDRLKDDATEK